MQDQMLQLPAKLRKIRPIGTTARVLTLQGLMKLRDDLKGEDPEVVRWVREHNKDVYFRDRHGSLRRVFPKEG